MTNNQCSMTKECLMRTTLHPGGMADNSPTFQRWEPDHRSVRVPKGRLNYAHSQPSLRDLLPDGRQFPTLKRWAIIASPSGTKTCLAGQNRADRLSALLDSGSAALHCN